MPSASDLELEDGSGKDDANTYAEIATADSYHDLRGHTAWAAATEADKVVALIDATQYLDLQWRFIGVVANPSDPDTAGQALQWPRAAVQESVAASFGGIFVGTAGTFIVDSHGSKYADDEIPFWIVNATLEYALASLNSSGGLLPDPTVPDTAGRSVSMERRKVSSLETETRYDTARATKVTRTYAMGDQIVRRSGLAILGGRKAVRA